MALQTLAQSAILAQRKKIDIFTRGLGRTDNNESAAVQHCIEVAAAVCVARRISNHRPLCPPATPQPPLTHAFPAQTLQSRKM